MDAEPAENPVLIRYLWDPEALTSALRLHSRGSRIRWVWVFLLGFLAVIYLPMLIFAPLAVIIHAGVASEAGRTSLVLLTGFGCLMVLFIVLIRRRTLLRWQAKRIFRSSSLGSYVCEWDVSDEELIARSPVSASTVLWPLFVRAVEAPEAFLLYQNAQLFYWFPSNGFASEEELDRFRELVRRHIKAIKVIGPARFVGKPVTGFEDI